MSVYKIFKSSTHSAIKYRQEYHLSINEHLISETWKLWHNLHLEAPRDIFVNIHINAQRNNLVPIVFI